MSTENLAHRQTATAPTISDVTVNAPGYLKVIRRNGTVTPFDANKIAIAMTKAFLAVEGLNASGSSRVHETVKNLLQTISDTFARRMPTGGIIHIEDIQDRVELTLMRHGEHKVARSYVLYREERRKARSEQKNVEETIGNQLHVTLSNGEIAPLDLKRIMQVVNSACQNLEDVSADLIIEDTKRNLFDKVPVKEVSNALIMSARVLIEKEPNYSYVAARLLADDLRGEALSFLEIQEKATHEEMKELYFPYLSAYLDRGIELELISPKLKAFDLKKISAAIKPERDLQFTYLGLQTLYDRYFLHSNGTRFELPQAFFMRVAMGLACEEKDKEDRAIEFYDLLSSFDFMSSTPTLFNSGTLRPQLSSCYLTTVPDDLDGIFAAIKDNALLSKYAGGLGNDWTSVRAMGAPIKGTNGKSLGVVPFLSVANATAVAVNQCFAPETMIYTSKGIKPIAEVTTNDLVLGVSGTYRPVTQTYVYNQQDPMVTLDLKHAIDSIRVTTGHPFYAIRGVPLEQSNERTLRQLQTGKVKCDWIEAGELQRGDYVAQTIPTEIVPVANVNEEEARLYGILLGDGHLSKDSMQWGVSGNPSSDNHLAFIRTYLTARSIHYWENQRNDTYLQINWATGRGAVRDGTTGRIVGSGSQTLPFSYDDIYNEKGEKHIAARLAHLPKQHTLALIQGLIETDGNVSRNKEITFCNTSQNLAEGLRYQCLRLGVPTAGNKRLRKYNHTGTRSDGSKIFFNNESTSYDVRIPAVAEIAERLNCKVITKRNWLEYAGHVFTRVKKSTSIEPTPFVFDLKVEGDVSYMTTVGLAHNGGKRKGAVCGYLETWHKDIEEFLELRKNTGDERRRTHDMNTANWIPDLFMQRVIEEKDWTLFSPNEVPDLHDLYGKDFEAAYTAYEARAEKGEISTAKKIPALTLWRKMLGMLFETGHPWVTFKDPCNLRSPQQHAGVVHSSNLCTEITLNTSIDEIAVCNLGSINLTTHLTENGLDKEKLRRTINTAIRMLDNVIDINYYSVPQARNSNIKHRPIGMGIMAFQDALYKLGISYTSQEAVKFADNSMELISYYAIEASTNLAVERGTYSSFEGSLWSQGILPIDSIGILKEHRGAYLEQDNSSTMDWNTLRERVKKVGMRNSNVMAIAPTATIANICGVSQSIEPTYQNLFVKSNLSGEFTVINPYLVADLKAENLWDDVMVNDLKYYNGSVSKITRIPDVLKQRYATAFEIDPIWLVDAASRRQKWIDQGQSLNLYMAEPSGKKLDALYKHAWLRGLKTTYYLRSMGATNTEKSTIHDGALNAVQSEPKACLISDPECEACQ
ncbi:MAG: ribonucleoside-diphosphate reductase subunit alpha [Gammaproteobacteria bacterium]|nr:ribonucleoside-diphosphate reductase subunit alpha [Gammaproteobacteria bacterium]